VTLRFRHFKNALRVLIFLCPALYVSSCSYIALSNQRAFERTNIGDAEADILRRCGEPNVREKPGQPYVRYALPSQSCSGTCSERFWYENRLFLVDIEAWSIDFDSEHHVKDTCHWLSP